MNVLVSGITSRDFSLHWQSPVPSDRNGVIRSYSITLTDKFRGITTPYSVNGNVTLFEFRDLHPAWTYSLQVAAVTVSRGPLSDPLGVTMAEDGKAHINM